MLFNDDAAARNWLGFYAFIIFAWVINFLISFSQSNLYSLEALYGIEFWENICRSPLGFSDWLGLFFMWGVMGGAMMVPTLQPTLRTYSDLIWSGRGGWFEFWALLFGFLIVWLGFAAIAALGQAWFSENNWLTFNGEFKNPLAKALLLFLAAAYQLTPLKNACLERCRSPMSFILETWEPNAFHLFWVGVRIGVICVGCCWALMLLGFVGGTMNIIFMGVATLLMILEKLPDIGRYVTFPVASLLFMFGIFYGAQILK